MRSVIVATFLISCLLVVGYAQQCSLESLLICEDLLARGMLVNLNIQDCNLKVSMHVF